MLAARSAFAVMNVAQKNRFRDNLKAGARLAFFLVGMTFGLDPGLILFAGLLAIPIGFLAIGIANFVVGLGWLLIATLATGKVKSWYVGNFCRSQDEPVSFRFQTNPIVVPSRDTVLPTTSRERLSIMGGVLTAGAWVLVLVPLLLGAILFMRLWVIDVVLLLLLGAIYCLILRVQYEVEPWGSPMWMYVQSKEHGPAFYGSQALARAGRLRLTTGTHRDLSEDDVAALRAFEEPLVWKLAARQYIVFWHEANDRPTEALKETDALVQIAEEAKTSLPATTFATLMANAGITYATYGRTGEAERVADLFEPETADESARAALRALLLWHRGYREDAEQQFKQFLEMAKEIPFENEEARRVHRERLQKENPHFSHLIADGQAHP